jgi:hypothetical protein
MIVLTTSQNESEGGSKSTGGSKSKGISKSKYVNNSRAEIEMYIDSFYTSDFLYSYFK